MSKFLLIPLAAAALLTPAGAAPANATETCATAPTCAELGYTLTSTTNCVGTPLKCPFDKTKFFCTLKSEAITAMMPDYNNGRSLSTKTTHYMTENGWIRAGAAIENDSPKVEWFVNGHHLGTTFRAGDENSALYPVAKGDRVYHNGVASYNYLEFFPCRGN